VISIASFARRKSGVRVVGLLLVACVLAVLAPVSTASAESFDAAISGQVVGPDDQGVVDVDVQLYRLVDPDHPATADSWLPYDSGTSEASGTSAVYEISLLPAGTYRLSFSKDTWITQWYVSHNVIGGGGVMSGEPFTIADGEKKSGVDATLYQTLTTTAFKGSTARSLIVPYNGARILVGAVLGPSGNSLIGKTVFAESSGDGKNYLKGIQASEPSPGVYEATVRSASKRWHRFRFYGDQAVSGRNSGPSVVVDPKVSLTKPNTKSSVVRRNRSFATWGFLKPRPAAGAKSVQIVGVHYENGKWVKRLTVWAKNSNYSSYTKYAKNIVLSRKGRWYLVASHDDAGHAPTSSAKRYLTVR
jgi:hypothetical protein